MQARAATPVHVQVASAAPEQPVVVATPDHIAPSQEFTQLRDAGILTEEELDKKKQEILSRM